MTASPLALEAERALVRNAQHARASLARYARTDAAAFCAFVLKDEQTGAGIRLADMHQRWHRLIDEHPRLNLIAHVESGKSAALSVGRSLYELGRNPNTRVVVVSNTAAQATKIVRSIGSYLEKSRELREVFPALKPSPAGPWTNTQLTVERVGSPKDPSVQATGVHGSIVGARIDLLILDDLLDYENARTPGLRDDLWDWVHSTLFGRLTADARVISVGNAYHRDDFLHRLERNPVWHTVRFPVVDGEGRPSWPERWPLERIAQKREELGPLEFARQMLCQARDDAESRFKREWIELGLARGQGRSMLNALATIPPGCAVYTGVDLAIQQHSGADLTVFFTILVHPDGTREVLNIESGRLAGPEIVQKIQQIHHRYQGIVYVENNACFIPGTQVLTSTGYKAIETVEVGDLVWTHQGRWRPVTETHTGYSRTLVTAQAQGALSVQTTPNHWFWLRRAGRTPGRGGGHYRPVDDAEWVSYGMRNEAAYAAIATPRWPALTPKLRMPATVRMPAWEVDVSEELALVLGLYMAEGHSTKGQAYWTLHRREAYLADLIEQQVSQLVTCKVTRRVQGNTLRVVVNNSQLARALSSGAGAEKCLPVEWLGWPLTTRLALVRGWLLGDGCALQNNKSSPWPTWTLKGQTCSRNWAMFVRATLHEAGIASALTSLPAKTTTIEGREVQSGPAYSIALSRDDARKLRAYMTSSAEAVRWERWWAGDIRHAKHASNVRLVYDAGHGWSRVPEIEASPYREYNGPVHNLSVEEDHSYTVEEFIVHNAQDFIVQFTRYGSAVPVKPFTTGRNKAHPEFGVEGLAAEMAAGKWIIPSGGGRLHPEVDAWINELLYYDPRSHTGDRLMASWFAREAARAGTIRAEAGYLPTLRR